MFGMGLQEVLIILVIAVLVIGPEQLPKVARGIGQMMAQFKRVSNDLRDAMNSEISQYEEMQQISQFKSEMESEVNNFRRSTEDYLNEEIQREERELERLGRKETAGNAGDSAASTEPEPYQPGPGDFPGEAEQAGIADSGSEQKTAESGTSAGPEEKPAELASDAPESGSGSGAHRDTA